jgi:hypothetical protein
MDGRGAKRYRTAASIAFYLMVLAILLFVLSIGMMLVMPMDATVTDLDEDDFDPPNPGLESSEYHAKTRSSVPGVMTVTIYREDGEGSWARLTISEGSRFIESHTNITLPYTSYYQVLGDGEIDLNIAPEGEAEGFSKLTIEVAVTGPFGLGGALMGTLLSGPCCLAWIGSLIMAIVGLYQAAIERRRVERTWT